MQGEREMSEMLSHPKLDLATVSRNSVKLLSPSVRRWRHHLLGRDVDAGHRALGQPGARGVGDHDEARVQTHLRRTHDTVPATECT